VPLIHQCFAEQDVDEVERGVEFDGLLEVIGGEKKKAHGLHSPWAG
jgi:hypothetical protein